MSVTSSLRQRAAVVATACLALGPFLFSATPAFAEPFGSVRLAHLSPDTPAVDVYLSSNSGAVQPKVFPAVGYGVVSDYMMVPAGTYAVAMRVAGAAADSAPVLATQVNVVAGGAYTVAGVGRHADLGLRVIDDDLTLPAARKAKVRIVQASIRAPILDVTVATGTTIANGVAFASTTGYREVDEGRWTVRLQQPGNAVVNTVECALAGGNVYSLIVLDRPNGSFTAELKTDARRDGALPMGGVETGAGGTHRDNRTEVLIGTGVLALLGVGFVITRRRSSQLP